MDILPCHAAVWQVIFVGWISMSLGAVLSLFFFRTWWPKPDAPAAPVADAWSYVYDARLRHWCPSDNAPNEIKELYVERVKAARESHELERARADKSELHEKVQQLLARNAEISKGKESMEWALHELKEQHSGLKMQLEQARRAEHMEKYVKNLRTLGDKAHATIGNLKATVSQLERFAKDVKDL
eukprot:TRINITY_DN16542_c0_g2_i1.p1 TRINITY_DN16542_c0_g2~~TRINITY_DN16542_c0_g2_i1.p1  ORF type:complete len:185 (+),score=44.29 TRINITY_DN16542_c0_g2_i1:70-624(+)